MPKKKKGKSIAKILLVVVVLAVVTVGVVAWHDGLIGLTSINDINDGLVANGTSVAIKGEVTIVFGNLVTVNDGLNFVAFEWAGASQLNSIVVVRGTVSSVVSLANVTSMDIVWIFNEF